MKQGGSDISLNTLSELRTTITILRANICVATPLLTSVFVSAPSLVLAAVERKTRRC